MNPIKIGLIGFGRMGGFYLDELLKSDCWEVAGICDLSPEARATARRLVPGAKVVADEWEILDDPAIEAVALCALADSRPEQIARAIAAGKHIISEKPVADTVEHEWQAV